jgi:hypothetical protein
MSGTEYVIEQLGQALQASHEALSQQREQIAALDEALRAALAERPTT